METVSGQECQAWRSEVHFNINNRIVELLAKGKRTPKANVEHITEKESLIFKTTRKANILAIGAELEPEFAAYAGKKVPTDKIFERTAKNENELSA